MPDPSLVTGLLGGIGLFLLGMWLMTEGLRLAAGRALTRILARSTRTRWHGLASGILVTALVQSSSAVTVAAIGFVNAGLLSLAQVLWVIFGANVGTTMTGWLVAIAGIGFKIDAAAFPLIGCGMLLHLTGSGTRRGAGGMALAGFGVLFLGIDVLKDAFAGLGNDLQAHTSNMAATGLPVHILTGVVLTVLMQSSSAALALALTAAQGGLLPLPAAAGIVIGANVGTTVTAIIAALGATSAARRTACAHVLFNVLTGIAAVLLLPLLLQAITSGLALTGSDSAPAVVLALFHTAFNLLGVCLMWPLAAPLAGFLQARFRTVDEDLGHPRYLDAAAAAIPALPLQALEREIRRFGSIVVRALNSHLHANSGISTERQALLRLAQAIAVFVNRLNRTTMSAESAGRLAALLRVVRYYETMGELGSELGSNRGNDDDFDQQDKNLLQSFRLLAATMLHSADPGDASERTGETPLSVFQTSYQALKAGLLEQGAHGQLGMAEMEGFLRQASLIHRAVEQAVKADRLLYALPPVQADTSAVTAP